MPINPSSALLLTRNVARQIAFYKKGRWYVRVNHVKATDGDMQIVKESLARFALTSIYGPSQKAVDLNTTQIGASNKVWPSLLVGEGDCDLICHVYDYFRVVSALAKPPSEAQAAADRVDLTSVSRDWTFPIACVGLRPERSRGGVIVDGHTITEDMRLGIGIKRLRVQYGEAIRGAYAVFPIRHFVFTGHLIGEDCVTGADGRANRTYMRDERMSKVRRVDLPPRGKFVQGLPAFARKPMTRGTLPKVGR